MKDKYTIWLDGKSNSDAGIVISSPLKLDGAVPNVKTHSIPGRNGDLHIYDGSFKNRKASVSAYVYSKDGVKYSFSRVNEWIWGAKGYRRLETDDDLDHFMLARITNAAAVDARIRKIAPFAINFDCKPQRFLKSGEEEIFVESGMRIYNPTSFPARPIIKIAFADLSMKPGSPGDGRVVLGDSVINVTGMQYGTGNNLEYDSENDNAASSSGLNRNQHLSISGDVVLPEGETTITFDGGIIAVRIIPRWWEI